MAYEVPGTGFGTVKAGSDLSAKQYRFMKATTTAGQIDVCSVAGEASLGVLQNDPASGEAAEIMSVGITKVEAGAAVTAGDKVMTDANGRAITAATAGSKIQGQALEAATAAGQYITIALVASNGVV